MARLSPGRASWVLVALVGAAAAVRLAGARTLTVPWITPDEPVYALLGRSLWSDGTFTILGEPAPYYSLLYPALVGLPLQVGDAARAVELAQALQALVVSLVAVPVYAWGRRFLSPGASLAAAALTLTLPGLAYAGFIMSETLAYPVVLAALYALARAVARPGLLSLGLATAATTAAAGVRMQALVLVPAFATAVLVDAWLGGGRRRLRAFRPVLVAIGLAAAAGAGLLVAGGVSVRALLGAYGAVGERGYDPLDVARELVWHTGGLAVMTLGAPIVATVLLAVRARRRREPDADLRAFLAVTLSYCAWLVVEVALFASRYVDHVAERYLVTAAPPLLLGLVAWVALDAPRPRPVAALTALAAVAAAALVPAGALVHHLALHDAFTTGALVEPLQGSPVAARLAVTALVAAGAAGAVLVPARRLRVVPAAIGSGLALLAAGTYPALADASAAAHERTFAERDPRWIDRAAAGPVALLTTGERTSGGIWRTAFWNRSVAGVVVLDAAPVPGPLPQVRVEPLRDGTLEAAGRPLRVPYVAAPAGVALRGERIAGVPAGADQPGIRLWRVEDEAVRLSYRVLGRRPNGDFTEPLRVTAYACGGGRLALVLLGKSGAPVSVHVSGVPYLTATPPPDGLWEGEIPAPPYAGPDDACSFVLYPQGLTGSTRVEFLRP